MEKELELLIQLAGVKGNGSQEVKASLLRNNWTDELEYILQVCYNPFITTKLNKVDYDTTLMGVINEDNYQTFKGLIEDLKVAPSANQTFRQRAYNLITNSGYNPEKKLMLGRIITKNMNISLGAKLINKAMSREVIPDPSFMLAKDDITRIDKWNGIICEYKYDGVRIIANLLPNGEIIFYTRAFNIIPERYMKSIVTQIKELAGGKTGIFFDGELTDFDRKSVSGKVTSILAGTAPEDIGETFLFNLFDVEGSWVIDAGKGKDKYPVRRKNLENHFEGKTFTHLLLAKKWELKSKDEILEIYKHIVEVEKGEGIILKDPNHVYECKRSFSWIKIKEEKDCDLEIIAVCAPHTMSKREEKGWIGGFKCQTSDGKLTVDVGSGYSEALLEEIKANGPETYIGKIVTVKYNMMIEDKHGSNSLFLPRLIDIRPDKTEADDISKLLEKKGKI